MIPRHWCWWQILWYQRTKRIERCWACWAQAQADSPLSGLCCLQCTQRFCCTLLGSAKLGQKKKKHIKMIKKVMCTVIYQRRLFFHTSLPPSTPYTSSDLSMMKTHPSNCKKSRCYRFKDLYAQSHLQQISIFKNRHFVLSLTLNSANLSMFLDVFLKRENSPLFSQNDFFMLSKTWGFISHDKNSRNKNV